MATGRFVIVGASLAGASAAAALRDGGFEGDLTLIGEEARLPYSGPGASKGYLRGQERFEDQLVSPADYYGKQRITVRLGARATRVDPARRVVELGGGETVPCDRLLVASGGRNRTLHTPGADLSGVFQLRTVEDCDRIRAAARRGARAVVVGMGFIGSELTASLRPMGAAVSAIEGHPGPLAAVPGPQAARAMLGGSEPYDYIRSFWSDQYEHLIEYVGFAATWDRLVFRGKPESRKFLGFYLKDGVLRAAVGLDRGGDPEDPKSESELKTVAGLIRSRARVDPARLVDETVELSRLAPAPA